MQPAYNTYAPKTPANLSVNSDLLKQAKDLRINLSATFEHSLIVALAQKRRELWLADNRAAIAAYNEYVATDGVFSDELRSF